MSYEFLPINHSAVDWDISQTLATAIYGNGRKEPQVCVRSMDDRRSSGNITHLILYTDGREDEFASGQAAFDQYCWNNWRGITSTVRTLRALPGWDALREAVNESDYENT